MNLEIKIGGCYRHRVHGNCIVVHQNKRGFWIQVWGGPSGDKLYTFKEIKGSDILPR